ncbi:hypothetical protein G6F43_007657 [Rhizopus delemar]|nr:hypothetical protein G6F43_007657 [Rhizopus delemar]
MVATQNSLLSNRAYRLYAGHGNWINLGENTTNDLLDIFAKGVPTRYQLSPGLFIDIIPHDVDCNSKNIDMLGLMRADLVYESTEENTVQQAMSNYIRGLLDDQGIIDAFPPVKSGENLPHITSLPSHRHLSLVPSVTGVTRRGPKSSHDYNCDSSSKNSSTQLKKKSSTPFSKRLHKKAKAVQKDEFSKKMILPSSTNVNFASRDSYGNPSDTSIDFMQSHQQHSGLWTVPAASFTRLRTSDLDFEFNPPSSSSSTNIATIAHPEGFDSQPTLQRLSPTLMLNAYDHEFVNSKSRILSSYYPCSQSSLPSSANVHHQLLEHHEQQQQEQQSFNEIGTTSDSMISSSCWVGVQSNTIKDEEERWMSSMEYSGKDDSSNMLIHHEPTMTQPSFDLHHRSSVDHGYYFNDSSKSTTGPSSPNDVDDITTLPESVKRVLL